jgi:hypothetical protein
MISCIETCLLILPPNLDGPAICDTRVVLSELFENHVNSILEELSRLCLLFK